MDLSEDSKYTHILIVSPPTEANNENRNEFLDRLARPACRLAQVSTIAEARAWLQEMPVDMILFDVGNTRFDQLAEHAAASISKTAASRSPFAQWPGKSSPPAAAASLQNAAPNDFIAWLHTESPHDDLPVLIIGQPERLSLRRWAIHIGAIDYLSYSANETEIVDMVELASERQTAIAAEVRRQVQERYQDIIGMIQHEFRTPMTLLLGYGEYLREALHGDIDPAELQLSVEAILNGSERLNRLIENFLQLSELQYRQRGQLQKQPVVPGVLWREAQAILRTESEESGLEIVYDMPPQTPNIVVDPELVRQALTRLLDNALHYVRPESRRISLGVDVDEQWITWRIEDEGPGITAEQIARILSPFDRVENNLSAPQSMGLSLAIVKRVAALHGGELQLESQVDQGSRFILRLPRENGAA